MQKELKDTKKVQSLSNKIIFQLGILNPYGINEHFSFNKLPVFAFLCYHISININKSIILPENHHGLVCSSAYSD